MLKKPICMYSVVDTGWKNDYFTFHIVRFLFLYNCLYSVEAICQLLCIKTNVNPRHGPNNPKIMLLKGYL